MNWILASSLMFLSSVILYLLVRKCSLLNIPSVFQNLAMFAIPFFLYLGNSISTKTNLLFNWHIIFILLIMSFFFSYFGAIFSLKSIELAPNPGYSLVLSKSYVVFTTLVAVFLFHGTLTVTSALAIVVIIISSSLVMITINQTKKDHVRALWLPLAMGAFFCWGLLSLGYRYLQTLGIATIPRLTYVTGIVTVLILIELHVKKIVWKKLNKEQVMLLAAVGIAGTGLNYFMGEALNTAPNIGYVNAINASSIAIVAVFSALFFKDELTKRKLIGVIGVIGGLTLLVIS